MRGDGVGIGDIGEMQGGSRGAGVETCGGDGWVGVGEPDGGVVDGRAGAERDAGGKSGGGRVSIDDGAWGRHGDDGVHGARPARAYGV